MSNLIIKGKTSLFGIGVPNIFGGFSEDQKAMLVKSIAGIHGKEVIHINAAINRNRNRFIDGEHILDMKQHPQIVIHLVDNNFLTKMEAAKAEHIYLLSQRGYVRLLKIMDDETAWEQWDVIEKDYFELKEQQQAQVIKLQPLTDAAADAFALADLMIARWGVKPNMAEMQCLAAAEKNTGLDLSDIKRLAPATEQESIGRLTATEIAKRLNIRYKTGKPDPKTINKLLITAGLMEKSDDKKQPYKLTDAGKDLGEIIPYTRNGHSGYEIRWNESVLKLLSKQSA
ncbi:MAG TPA: ORF6N domain-containing protein [Methylomusa anaerophila]|uniref:ORF6N domain protein n=1 Tax=Methylomusa anaerophila TaxID=1930071 RepID=A0A348AIX0_9FIRM|nr:ORF6N domain-containing protein [Methylomusa anaerophila]BBB91018.1 ORF6N domain protein [Methylomusa anaerophila]HML88889.1 ORF6N domain-containing protein [Methylomusa anaerophila]